MLRRRRGRRGTLVLERRGDRLADTNTCVYLCVYLSVTLYDKPLSGERVSVDIKHLQFYRCRVFIDILIA